MVSVNIVSSAIASSAKLKGNPKRSCKLTWKHRNCIVYISICAIAGFKMRNKYIVTEAFFAVVLFCFALELLWTQACWLNLLVLTNQFSSLPWPIGSLRVCDRWFSQDSLPVFSAGVSNSDMGMCAEGAEWTNEEQKKVALWCIFLLYMLATFKMLKTSLNCDSAHGHVFMTLKRQLSTEKLLCCIFHGGGFFLACKDFGRMFVHSSPACIFLFFILILINEDPWCFLFFTWDPL